ncbi:copper chaperone PCu(A)C [Pseudomonas sp. MAFF212428]|uniref:Copper chaperone PCu(A)C n=2 Tax=Pseudomonas brassicae TaxID=2708063 RepID=A0A6B3NQ55_9PSED|nr:copper chaperone PCu(A)C [Pseudomonas brassicae]NER60686.1 copper chaperone PCu(A)C [Pseudomonas brassicae]NER65502.1 copper chaperone PCu(A)C [Pseudomonas brassicae]
MMRSPVKHALGAMALLSLFGAALPAVAQTTVEGAWVRASVPSQQATGAFMTITASADSKLVAVESPAAKTVQVHQMTMHNDVMGMAEVKSLALPAGKPVVLDSNGYHVMLMGLVKQVKEGDSVPLTLIVEDAKGQQESIKVDAPVRPLTATDGHDKHQMHDHSHM